MGPNDFPTKKQELITAYAQNGKPFILTTRGLHSTRSLQFDVVNQSAQGQIGYLVARRGQQLNFFNYGVNSPITLSGDANHISTDGDTNLTKAFTTPGSSDLAIEWITTGPKAIKAAYAVTTGFVAAGIDLSVANALAGRVSVADPFAINFPPEIAASATLEHVLYQAVAPHLTAKFEWDNADRTEKMGTFDQFVQGGGASYLRSNGEPSVANRFRIPEGYLWAREGQPSGQMQVVARLEDDVVIPFTPTSAPLDNSFPALTNVWVEICMRVGGAMLRVPGSN